MPDGNLTTQHERRIAAVLRAKAERAAAEAKLNEAVLAAIDSGVSYGKLERATGMARGWLHTRATRARTHA